MIIDTRVKANQISIYYVPNECKTLQIGTERNTSLHRVPVFEEDQFGEVKHKPMLALKKSKF